MFTFIWPMALAVFANVLYNITTKSIPVDSNPYVVLTVAYSVSAILSLAGFYLFDSHKSLIEAVGKIDWTWFALAIAMVGLEMGYIFMYRVGWKISLGSLVSNILLAIALLIIGYLYYHERLTFQQICGVTICIAGLIILILGEDGGV